MSLMDIHVDNNFYIKVSGIKGFPGLKIETPKNIFVDRGPETTVYEIEENKITIYCNGIKIETIDCPNYAMRHLILLDIDTKARQNRISTHLIRYFDENGSILTKNPPHPIYSIIKVADDSQELESMLEHSINDVAGDNDVRIPEEIYDGFLVIVKRYTNGNKK